MTTFTHLECSQCGNRHSPAQSQNLCDCGGPLLARYDLAQLRETWNREALATAPSSMWRYAPALPVSRPSSIVSLGEGMTPLLPVRKLGARLGMSSEGSAGLWVKDEGLNPTGSFKARGLSCAVSMCVELGARKLAIPSAGNAAGAMAAYAAAAGLEAHIFMPRDVPQANFIECVAAGARVTLIDGLISDCARIVSERRAAEGWFDVSTLKEPYRIEGKKTMGYELAEQFPVALQAREGASASETAWVSQTVQARESGPQALGDSRTTERLPASERASEWKSTASPTPAWSLPDAIFYPCGGGVGLIGMWKAFEEMEALGWISSHRPKMIAVQAEGCAPLVRAFETGAARSEFFPNAHTVASGLRVPKALGDFLVLDAVRQSGGACIAVSDEEMLDAGVMLASDEGIFAAPEGGACVAALAKLLSSGFLKSHERIVIYNTGSGLKYLEAYSTRFPRA